MVSGKIKTLDFYRTFTLEASQDIKKTSKYDSIREEIQEELFHLDKQMHHLKKMRQDLARLRVVVADSARKGAVVITDKARFYICTSLGEFYFLDDRFYAISPESPMARTMEGKKVGEAFQLNGIQQEIQKIF